MWGAAGYPWSVRLKEILRLWRPWIRQRFHLTPEQEEQLRTISPSTMDRALRERKRILRRRLYGRTRPGTLLRHQIPIQTEAPKVEGSGLVEVGLVAHCNYRLLTSCRKRRIPFTRSRPYRKDDQAHIEQKNWTHVRKLLGWDRYDTEAALTAINDLYRQELRLWMNLFLPSVRLIKTVRRGSRLHRVYDVPKTPLDRLRGSLEQIKSTLSCLAALREKTARSSRIGSLPLRDLVSWGKPGPIFLAPTAPEPTERENASL